MTIRLGSVAPVGFQDFANPDWLAAMKDLGCSSVQMYRNRHGNDESHDGPVTTEQMLRYVRQANLPCDSLHGLYGQDLDPSSPDEDARRAAVDTFRQEGLLARTLGGPLVVVHTSSVQKQPFRERELQRRRSQLRTSMDDLQRIGEELNVLYAMENLPPYHAIGHDVAELAEMIGEKERSHVGMCFDVAHAHLAGEAIESLRAAAGQVCYMHVCDNLGKTDDHLLPFLGDIDWTALADMIAGIDYEGVVMIESFASTDEIRKYIQDGYAQRLADWVRRAGNTLG